MKKFLTLCMIIWLSIDSMKAQEEGGGEAYPNLKTNSASLKVFQDMRFGMFIHWGPVTLRGTEIGWSRGVEVPITDYDNLYKEFNPMLFNAKEWVNVAKSAGMKYIVITSKHHDGFCLWNSKFTDYNIMKTPFHRDVLKELSDECKKQGIMFCTYYSILDWHHPDYTTRHGNDNRPTETSEMKKYIEYLHNQVKELIVNYHTRVLWFDGEWEASWTHKDGMELYAYIRGLDDKILINNRVDKGRPGMKGMTTDYKYAGDFGTPEQEIGKLNNETPWESCITIGKQWSWKPNDTLKSTKECLVTLITTAASGGNLLFNISPIPDGRIEQRQIDRLKAMGQWLSKYGESIYGTKGGPIKPTPGLVSTYKENKIYIHLLQWPKEELSLPVIPNRHVVSVHFINGQLLKSTIIDGKLSIKLPTTPIDEIDTVVVLELDGTADGIHPIEIL